MDSDVVSRFKSTLLSGFYLVAILLTVKRFGPIYGLSLIHI